MLIPLVLPLLVAAQPAAPKPFELKDGDRVVWLGSTLVEREQRYGYWETALYAAFPKARFTVRNLGWSGDTVWGESRGRFDFANPEKCFRQLVDQTLELKPTVVFIFYGANESFEGKEGLPKFEKGLEKLLDALKPAEARIVLFSPMRFYRTPSHPDSAPKNQNVKLYRDAIQSIAGKRDLTFADLHHVWPSFHVVSENGMHLTEDGYRHTASQFVKLLGLWHRPIAGDRHEALRQAVIAKNELFFHRWRPQNETYLFGFRKHEQGKNAKEVAEFDPLVAKAEEEIERIRKTLK
jgi:hypothetical protein